MGWFPGKGTALLQLLLLPRLGSGVVWECALPWHPAVEVPQGCTEVMGSTGRRAKLLLTTPKVIKQSEQAEDVFQLPSC